MFADLGFRNAELEELKANLTLQIPRIIKARDSTQPQVGTMLGVGERQASFLMQGRPSGASPRKLEKFLTKIALPRPSQE